MDLRSADPKDGDSPPSGEDRLVAIFEAFLAYEGDETSLLLLARNAITIVVDLPLLAEALERRAPKDPPSARLESARRLGALAKAEVERDFPRLHAHALVALWGALESLADEVTAERLSQEPKILDSDPFRRLRIQLAEFLALDDDHRFARLVELAKSEIGLQKLSGASRLEAVFALAGLAGTVDEEQRLRLHELHQIRNVIVHRRGVADRRLARLAPSLPWKAGEAIQVDAKRLSSYHSAAMRYAANVLERIPPLVVPPASTGNDAGPGSR